MMKQGGTELKYSARQWIRVILAIILFGLSIVLGFRDARPTWSDEVFTLSNRAAYGGWVKDSITEDVHPPLYFTLSAIAGSLWQTDAGTYTNLAQPHPGARLLAYALYFLLIALTLVLLNKRLDSLDALLSIALLLASSAHLALFGPMMRYYSLSAIGVVCSTLLLISPTNEVKNPTSNLIARQILYGLCIFISLTSSYITFTAILAHFLYLLRKPLHFSKGFFAALLVSGIITAMFLWMFPQQLRNVDFGALNIQRLAIGTIARMIFSLYSFLFGEFIRPWNLIISIPAILSASWLIFLAARARKTEPGSLIWFTFSFCLTLGSLILAYIGIGIEFSASRIMFLAPLLLILIGIAPALANKSKKEIILTNIAFAIFISANILSTFNYWRKADFIQSTYIIPWNRIACDISKNLDDQTILLYDDDTLMYYLPPDILPDDSRYYADNLNWRYSNINDINIPENVIYWKKPDKIILVYSPKDITAEQTVSHWLKLLDENYMLEKEIEYTIENETSIRLKSMLLRRPVERVKKALRIYIRR